MPIFASESSAWKMALASKNETLNHSSDIDLAKALTVGQALRSLYLHKKASDRKFSLAFCCKRLNLNSTGHLADVMKGRRRLRQQHISRVVSTFSLSGHAAKYVRLLFEIEHEKDEARLAKLQRSREIAQRALLVDRKNLAFAAAPQDIFFSFLVFSSF